MNKSELVKALADQANISLDEATLVVNTFVDSMKDSLLEGGRVEIRVPEHPNLVAKHAAKEFDKACGDFADELVRER